MVAMAVKKTGAVPNDFLEGAAISQISNSKYKILMVTF
jgi:hypothetical protein